MGAVRALLPVWIVVGSLGYSRTANACSPCDDQLSLKATATAADLVVVAARVGDEQAASRGVQYAPFEITRVLKGSAAASQILVATRYGMCHYGIDAELRIPMVLFLEADDGRYKAVRDGCAVKSVPIVDGKAVLRDISLPVDTLAAELGISPAPGTKAPESPRWLAIALVCLALAGSLSASFWLGRRSAR